MRYGSEAEGGAVWGFMGSRVSEVTPGKMASNETLEDGTCGFDVSTAQFIACCGHFPEMGGSCELKPETAA